MRVEQKIACLFSFCVAMAISAAAQTVAATDSIWLAAQPTGTVTTGFFESDTAPANSPVGVAIGGQFVTFTASGSASVDGSCFAGPAGGCYSDQSSFSPAPWSTDYNGAAGALIGIFTDGTPSLTSNSGYTGPVFATGPDYQNPANVGPGTYAPALDQIFLIGTGSGETFDVPTGATELYLAVADSLGSSTGNLGSFAVTTSFSAGTTPEPGGLALLGTGLLGTVAMFRRRMA